MQGAGDRPRLTVSGGQGRRQRRLLCPTHPHLKFFPEEKKEIHQKGPKLEVDFRYTNFWGASDAPSGYVALLFLYGALDSHPVFPSHVASGRCVLSAAAAGAPAGVVSAFAEPRRWCAGAVQDVAGCAVCAVAAPSSWCAGAVLDVAGCAVCASAAPSSWRIGGRLTVFAARAPPPPSGRPPRASLRSRVREARVPPSSTRYTGRPPPAFSPPGVGHGRH